MALQRHHVFGVSTGPTRHSRRQRADKLVLAYIHPLAPYDFVLVLFCDFVANE